MRRVPGRVGVWLAVGFLAACQTDMRRSSPVLTAPLPDAGVTSPLKAPGRRLAPRPSELAWPIEVAVRIEEAEGSRKLVLKSGARSLSVQRLGEGLEAGGRVHARLAFEASGPHTEVSWNGRAYGGRFEVLPHPQGGLRLFNLVDLETYVEGVVASELPLWSARPAELQAQAIAARTFALHTMAMRGAFPLAPSPELAPLSDSVADQAYGGRPANGLRDVEGDALRERMAMAVRTAVAQTRGRVLTRQGRLEDVRYHASCGGRTSDIEQVFPKARPGSTGAECPCGEAAAGAQKRAWKHTFSAGQLGALARTLGVGERVVSLSPVQVQPWRWSQVLVRGESGQTQVSFLRLRSLLGPNLLRSGRIQGTWPHPGKIIEPGGGWAVYGAGHGHGAGLCQTGTHLLAGRDWSATRILHHYFSGAVVRSLPLSGSRRP